MYTVPVTLHRLSESDRKINKCRLHSDVGDMKLNFQVSHSIIYNNVNTNHHHHN